MKTNNSIGSYLLEFLMMFLAITLGFFAENMREGISEHSKAKELAQALIVDLAKDTVSLSNTIRLYENRRDAADTLFELMRQPSFSEINQRTYYRLVQTTTNYGVFSPSGGTANQLKNSGYLSLLSDTKLFFLLAQYDSLQSDYKTNWDREMSTCFVEQMYLLPRVTDAELFYIAFKHTSETEEGKISMDYLKVQSKKGIDPIPLETLKLFRFNLAVLRVFSSSHVIHFKRLKRTAKEMIKHLSEKYS